MCELRKRMEQKLDAMMEDCQEAQRQGKDHEAQFGFKWCAWLRETLNEEIEMAFALERWGIKTN